MVRMSSEPSTPRYWAFISYSRQDEAWAQRVAGRLEKFRIPTDLRGPPSGSSRSTDRLGPVFRDRQELSASADLEATLNDALLASEYLLVICSPAAAKSKWVNLEIEHFIRHRGADRILLLVVDGEPRAATEPANEAFPPAILALPREPLWVDVRPGGDTKGHALIRIAAAMLGVGFDALWQRQRRRQRWLLAGWAASLAALATIVIVIFVQQQLSATAILEQQRQQAAAILAEQQAAAAKQTPQAQIAAFETYLRASLKESIDHATDDDINYRILSSEDLNGDSRLDFIVLNQSKGFCGSGGCDTSVYFANADGTYTQFEGLFGNVDVHPLQEKTNNVRDIAGVEYAIDGKSLWSIYQWQDKDYVLAFYKFCGGVALEYCSEPDAIIDPIPFADSDKYQSRKGSRYYPAPGGVPPLGSLPAAFMSSVFGKMRDKDWYLVEIGKEQAAFIEGRNVVKPRGK
jgi:hypothetical protein